MNTLTRSEAVAAMLAGLALDTSADPEIVIAASLRRAASLRCPLTRGALEALVGSTLAPIVDVADGIENILESVLASGDLIEARVDSFGTPTQVFLGAPRFVRRRVGDVLLIGVRPDAAPLVPDELHNRVRSIRHLTLLSNATDDELGLLREHGFDDVSEASWMRHEEPTEASSVVDMYLESLDRQSPSGPIDGLRILDPTRPPAYYRGRWRSAAPGDSGMFVARRPQRYGAEVWTLVSLQDGTPQRMLDLPIQTDHRGCDEAWRLQAAVDSVRSTPQVARVERTGEGRVRIGISLPPPRWLQRRWDLLGMPSTARLGIVAYEFTPSDGREEIQFLKEQLWMTAVASKENTA